MTGVSSIRNVGKAEALYQYGDSWQSYQMNTFHSYYKYHYNKGKNAKKIS